MKKYIFITHSSHDGEKAKKVRDYLETNGIQCWMAPRDIPVGAEWAEAILEGIENASGMLLVFSSNSNNSPQVRREIERAIHNNIPIFPVRIENVVPSKAMEYYISSNHWMDAFGGNLEVNLLKLVTAIKGKYNITEKTELEPTTKPVQTKEHRTAPTLKINIKTTKQKFNLPKFLFRIPRKVLLSVLFLFLLVIGYFISKSFENLNPIEDVLEATSIQREDTIYTFIKRIASTDEFDDYVSGIKVTDNGNYVIMGYSCVNEFEGKPWIAMFDSLGNEMWKNEGSLFGGEGEFDIYPDGRSVWAYPMVDTMLVNSRGMLSRDTRPTTLKVQELLSASGESVLRDSIYYPIFNTDVMFGRATNMQSRSYGSIRDVHLADSSIYILTVSCFFFSRNVVGQNMAIKFDLLSEEDGPATGGPAPLFETYLQELQGNEGNFEHIDFDKVPSAGFGSSNIETIGKNLYTASVTPISMELHSWTNSVNDNSETCLASEFKTMTYSIIQNANLNAGMTFPSFSKIFLMINSEDELTLTSLFPDGNIYCLKVDEKGTEIWLKSFSTASSSDQIFGATFIDDAYFIYGQSYSSESGSFDGYLLKIDEEGNAVWERTYDFGDNESLWGIDGTSDGGLVLVFQSEVNGTSDVFLSKANSLGIIPEQSIYSDILLFENWGSSETLQNNWLIGNSGYWDVTRIPEINGNYCLSVRNAPSFGTHKESFSINSSISVLTHMTTMGFANIDSTRNFLRVGLFESESPTSISGLTRNGNSPFPALKYLRFNEAIGTGTDTLLLESAWFHWDYDNNDSFGACGRIGIGYFNGDSIVVGRVEPDTAWVEYSVLNDFEIKIDGNSADYFINDSLFFHTDEFVCDSESLYLYLGGASNTVLNAIGEVRVTSE